MIKPQDKKSKGNKNRRISDMNKYGYNFDWQENRGYEEIEALNKKTIAAGEVNLGDNKTEDSSNITISKDFLVKNKELFNNWKKQ